MEGNDIGITYTSRYAVRFEGLLMSEEEVEHQQSGLFGSFRKPKVQTRWVSNDLPIKSLLHLCNHLQVQVMVITYLDESVSTIEKWLSRKGAHVEVVKYGDMYEWADDLRRNPEVRHYYTSDVLEQQVIGFQHVTVTTPDRLWGI